MDTLLTLSCIKDTELFGGDIEWSLNPVLPNDTNITSYTTVRINFALHDTFDTVSYPLQHCASWFVSLATSRLIVFRDRCLHAQDLLNKYHTILYLSRAHDKQHCPEDFRMFIGQHVITETNWTFLQRQEGIDSQTLDIWLKTLPKRDLSIIPYLSKGDSEITKHDNKSLKGTDALESESLGPMSVLPAFFEWPVLNGAGDIDDRPELIRAGILLDALYKLIATRRAKGDQENHEIALPEYDEPGSPSKILLRGRDNRDAYNACLDFETRRFFYHCRRLLRAFVPRILESRYLSIGVIGLFWGAVHELLVSPSFDSLKRS